MNPPMLNEAINDYVSANLSPHQGQRDYIKAKYAELRAFLNSNCFRTGSYARYTAINPVHDLDVIFVVGPEVYDNPVEFMAVLKRRLENSDISNIDTVEAQTHSVTITFTDSPIKDFAIDVVPAIETDEYNEFDQPIYVVPEILEANRQNREKRYSLATGPIEWIKSDPRGYVKAASLMNEENENFRHATKLGKSWRHACKMAYGAKFKLKSFHFEQMFYDYFAQHPYATTLEAVIACFYGLPDALDGAQFPDRANRHQFIDEYVEDLSDQEKALILGLQADAARALQQLEAADTPAEVIQALELLLSVEKPSEPVLAHASSSTPPRQPWAA